MNATANTRRPKRIAAMTIFLTARSIRRGFLTVPVGRLMSFRNKPSAVTGALLMPSTIPRRLSRYSRQPPLPTQPSICLLTASCSNGSTISPLSSLVTSVRWTHTFFPFPSRSVTILPSFWVKSLSHVLHTEYPKTKKPQDVRLRLFFSNTLFRRLATFPSIRVSSPQQSLTSEFGMGSGVTSATNHQNTMFEHHQNVFRRARIVFY